MLKHILNRIIPLRKLKNPNEYFEGGGRDVIYFVKSGRKIQIYVELCCEGLIGKTWRSVSLGSVAKHYESPYEAEPIPEETRRETFEKLLAYYDSIGQKYEVDTFRM